MGGSNFDQIAQAVLQQQKVMQDLQEQNNQLRQQILDLKSGRGISVLINGTPFTLDDAVASPPAAISSPAEATPDLSTPPPASKQEHPLSTFVATSSEENAPTDIAVVAQEQTMIIPSAEQSSAEITPEANEETTKTPFLEDLMLSEFTSAMTSPLHTQGNTSDSSQHTQQTDPTNENDEAKQQADLRRALIGSYVLD